jgi:hypothetical protein
MAEKKSSGEDKRRRERTGGAARTRKREKIKQSQLDEAIEMTFPASDPVAIIQPAPDKDPADEAAQSDGTTVPVHK